MKVYITYQPDGYNGSMVDKIFLSKERAIDYVLDTKLAYLKNSDIGHKESREMALGFVYTEDVVE